MPRPGKNRGTPWTKPCVDFGGWGRRLRPDDDSIRELPGGKDAVIPLEQVKDILSKLKGVTAPKFLFTSFLSPHLVRPTFRCTRVAQFGVHYAIGSSARSDASGNQGTVEQGDRTTT